MNTFLPLLQKDPEDKSMVGNIQSGLSMLREGISNAVDKTGDCINNRIVNPVNHFLKDLTQMDHEFKKVQEHDHEFRICLNGKYMTATDVLKMPMEENY
jgi:hypothetical protein